MVHAFSGGSPALFHSSEGPERRRPQAANERPDRGGECFEALDAAPLNQAPRRGVGELASPAPLPSGERTLHQVVTSDDLMRLNTGWQLSPEQWQENAIRRAALKAQTERMAEALECHGVKVRKALPMVAVASVTGETDEEESFRAICLLPVVAQRERRPILNALQWFQRNRLEGGFLRYAVITSGHRIPAWGSLRTAMARLHRRISRWAHEADRDWNIEVIYRGTEFTRDPAGTYHPHSNVLYLPRRPLSRARWSEFLSWSRRRLGAHWQDNGILASPDEAIKYPFKPAELEGAPSDELVWLWWETHRMKFAQPMGSFAAFRKQLDADGRKVAMVNRKGGARLEIVEKAKRDPTNPDGGGRGTENQIIAHTAPQFRFGPFAQPVTLVTNYTTEPKTPEGAHRLAIIRAWQDQAREWWNRNGAPAPAVARGIAEGTVIPIRVHTRRPTVQEPPPLTGATNTPGARGLALAGGSANAAVREFIDPITGEIFEIPAPPAGRRRA